MNVFALPGPEFLAVYAIFAAATLVALYGGRQIVEWGPDPTIDLKDPYLFACLRGGPAEVIRITTLGLIDRGLLQEVTGRTVVTRPDVQGEFGQARLEREVLNHFKNPSEIDSIVDDTTALRLASDYEDKLRDARLVPDAAVQSRRRLYRSAAILVLVGVGGAKLVIALAAGRSNVGFLIAMMAVSAWLAWKISNPYRTALGDSFLASARSVFSDLRRRVSSIQPGGATRELLWLTALFGVAALPVSTFPFARYFRPQGNSSSGGCGSGGGDGGGGGCGGGGGGCGGCGS
jgi:uncharacterized protein (TIGR04222 family)